MSTENPNYGYTRRQELSCTEQELSDYSNVVLLDREVLYVKRDDGTYNIKIGDGVKTIGELPYVDSKPPYDVVTNSIGSDSGGWAKLTIADDWTDRIQHPYRLIVAVYEDGMVYTAHESTFYSPKHDGACRVECSMSATAPQYYYGNDVYIPMVPAPEYCVYVKRLDGVCTGATLEQVDSIPSLVHKVTQNTRWVEQARIMYTKNGVSIPRPITSVGNSPYAIVCRTDVGEVLIGKCDSSNSAVSKKYVDKVLEPYEILKKRVDNIEGAAIDFIEDSTTAFQKTVPTNALPYAKIMKIGGKSYTDDGTTLKSSPVSELVSETSDGSLLDTFTIPESARPANGIDENACDYIAWESDGTRKKYVCIAIVDAGTLEWWWEDSVGVFYTTSLDNKKATGRINVMCAKYETTSVSMQNMPEYTITGGDNDATLRVKDSNYYDLVYSQPDLQSFRNSMSGIMIAYELSEPIITDVSNILPADNFIKVEGGGTITAVNERNEMIPTTINYMVDIGG